MNFRYWVSRHENWNELPMTKKPRSLISDNPSTAQIKASLPAVKLASNIASAFGFLGSKRATKIKEDADDLLAQAEILHIPDLFNEAFANKGWIATGSLSMEVMKHALELHKNGRPEEAIESIVAWFDEENIAFQIRRARRHHRADLRDTQLREALKLYLEGRYFAAVPLILIACDGMASDIAGYSPFKLEADLNCFDSIVGHESALPDLIGRMTKGVYKSSNEKLDFLNRNGILHGRSLGYANKEMCTKAWMLFLALADWVSDKTTENERRESYEREQSVTLRDSLNSFRETRRDQEIIRAFERTETSAPFDDLSNPELPVSSFNAFFEGWQNRNFGQMARNAMNPCGDSLKKQAGAMRQMTEFVELTSFELITVRHTTVARAEALVNVKAKTIHKNVSGIVKLIAFRCKPDGRMAMPRDDAHWCVQQLGIYSVMNEKFLKEGDQTEDA